MELFLVTKVIDGDTFEIRPAIPRHLALQTPMQRLTGVLSAETSRQPLATPDIFNKIRLRNINAPEPGTPQGEQAARYLKQLLEGKRVTFKPVGISHDRVVADVWRYPDKLFANAVMVYSGHAKWAYAPH